MKSTFFNNSCMIPKLVTIFMFKKSFEIKLKSKITILFVSSGILGLSGPTAEKLAAYFVFRLLFSDKLSTYYIRVFLPELRSFKII